MKNDVINVNIEHEVGLSMESSTSPPNTKKGSKGKGSKMKTGKHISPAQLDQVILSETSRYHYVHNVIGQRKYPLLTNQHQSHSLKPLPVDQLWTFVAPSTLAYRIAHFDGRSLAFGGPSVLALVLFDTRISKEFPKLNAKVIYSNETEVIIKGGHFFRLRKPKDDEFVHSHVVSFKLDSKITEIPYAVLLCMNDDCSKHTAHLTVYWEDPPDEKLDFSVCLHQAIFQESNHEKVAAWFEMNRSLGAQMITVYYQEYDSKVVSTVQKYVDEGFVKAYDWFNNFTIEADNNFGQAILAIDCFYRNMFKAKYVAFHDVDEILMPRKSPTWHGMWKKLIKKSPSASHFKFCHAAFHDVDKTISTKDSGGNETLGCPNLRDIPIFFKRTTRTAKVNCAFKRHKSFYIPLRVKKAAIHSATELKGFETGIAPVELGLLHHYRDNDYLIKEKKVQDLSVKDHYKSVMTGLIKKLC